MGALFLDFHHKGFQALFHTQCVGKQYFTNNEVEALSLDAYCVTNLNLNYTFRTRAARSVSLGLQINNLFNSEYESNGYGYLSLIHILHGSAAPAGREPLLHEIQGPARTDGHGERCLLYTSRCV